MSEKKSSKLSNLVFGSSSSSHNRQKDVSSDDETAELLDLSSKKSASTKVSKTRSPSPTSKRKTSSSSSLITTGGGSSSSSSKKKAITATHDYETLIRAAESKHSKKMNFSSIYAPKRQMLEMEVYNLKQFTALNELNNDLQRENHTLATRCDKLERRLEHLESRFNSSIQEDLMNESRRREAGADDESSKTCFVDWIFST